MKQLIWALCLLPLTFFGQTSWPSSSWASATSLTGVMDASGIAELSGLHWNPVTKRLYCVQDDGRLRVLQYDAAADTFTQIASKSVPSGPEGLTQADFAENAFYTIDENNYQIRKFTHNSNFGNMTLAKSWDLLSPPSPMPDTGNTGPEGICFVPDAALSATGFVSEATGQPYTSTKGMGGLMFVAHQNGGYVWVFDLNPNVSDDFAYVGKYKTNRAESCDLAFDRTTNLMYILHNTDSNYLEVTNLSSAMVSGERKLATMAEYFIANPTFNINVEGFAITPKCEDVDHVAVWLCRDVPGAESTSADVLREFTPFDAPGACLLGNPKFAESGISLSVSGNVLTVQCHAVPDHVDVFTSSGQKVASVTPDGGSASFDTSSWPPGLYVVLASGTIPASAKWIKM